MQIPSLPRIACAGFLALAAVPVLAQTPDEMRSLSASLSSERIQRVSGEAIDPSRAGYFRLRMMPSGFTKDNFCGTSDDQRREIRKLDKIWSWAIRKEMDWGAAAQIVYQRSGPDFSVAGFVPDAQARFFSVYQEGWRLSKCSVPETDFRTVWSPLIPFESAGIDQRVNIQFSVWYNQKTDRSRINGMVDAGKFALGLFGVPIGLLDQAAKPATDEVQRLLEDKTNSRTIIDLMPTDAAQVAATAYLGLAEPQTSTASTAARIEARLVPVASMFAQNKASYEEAKPIVSAMTPLDILEFRVTVPAGAAAGSGAGPATGQAYLLTLLARDPLYSAMIAAASYDAISENCVNLDRNLRDVQRFSRVDAAVILYAIARRKADANPLLGSLRKVPCLAERESLLAKLGIALPADAPVVPVGAPATRAEMDDAMRTFAQLRTTPADAVTGAQWAPFAFPLPVVDPANRFAWDNQSRSFAEAEQGDLHDFIASSFTGIGCWAYFEAPPFAFALGLGDAVGVGNPSAVRKSAALARLASGETVVLQFRYAPVEGRTRITGIAVAAGDIDARYRMRTNRSCRGPDREWMETWLGAP